MCYLSVGRDVENCDNLLKSAPTRTERMPEKMSSRRKADREHTMNQNKHIHGVQT